jgi:hypothetical protein
MDVYFVLLVVILLNAAVLWKPEKTLLMIITGPVNIVYGLLELAENSNTGETLWLAGIVIAVYGTSLIFTPAIEPLKALYKNWKDNK